MEEQEATQQVANNKHYQKIPKLVFEKEDANQKKENIAPRPASAHYREIPKIYTEAEEAKPIEPPANPEPPLEQPKYLEPIRAAKEGLVAHIKSGNIGWKELKTKEGNLMIFIDMW